MFASIGVEAIRTPVRAPRADAYVERWVRTIRQECLDQLLVVSRRHLESVLDEYVRHYNERDRTAAWSSPNRFPFRSPLDGGHDHSPNVLGGTIHEYERAA